VNISNLPKGPAVYAFENTSDSKLYIGSSINAFRRVQHHLYLLERGKHHNGYFQRAYDKHGRNQFRVFVLETLPNCSAQDLLASEQVWISEFAVTDPARGYNIHPSPAAGAPASAVGGARLSAALAGRKRGVMSQEGLAARSEALKRRWDSEGEKEFFGEVMRDVWATPQHRAKMAAAASRNRADPATLEVMRARMAANRMTPAEISAAHATAWWSRNAVDGFASNDELDQWIAGQYEGGKSARQIGLALGMSHGAVARRLRDSGIDMAKRGVGRRKPERSAAALLKKGIRDLPTFDRQVAELYAEGTGVHPIAKGYGVSSEAIRTSLHRSGVVIRGRGEQPSKLPAFRLDRRADAHC